MATIRAKFQVSKREEVFTTVPTGVDANGKTTWGPGKLITIHASPVYGNGDPEHENTKFWQATPSGSLVLGSVNEAVGRNFPLGAELYLDMTPASETPAS